MKRYFIVLFVSIFFITNSIYGWNDPSKSGKKPKPSSSFILKAANCTPSTGKKFIEFNNVSALIETGALCGKIDQELTLLTKSLKDLEKQ
jgi:hypothetical protein